MIRKLPIVLLMTLLVPIFAVPARSAEILDKQTVRDSYVYLLGRVIVIRQEQEDIKSGEDGSLKIFLAPDTGLGIPESNWLPAPKGKPFSLTFRAYVPKDMVKRGEWFPPAIRQIN
ncbi:MAG TPA: DUF1214 domain-containing protein [Afipia sp.]